LSLLAKTFHENFPEIFNTTKPDAMFLKNHMKNKLQRGERMPSKDDVYEKLEGLLRTLGLKRTELRVYRLLLEKKRPMRITEIQKELGISERSVREHVLNLYRKGILKRKLIEQGWLGYVYTAVSPAELLERIKKGLIQKIDELEREINRES
jgi:predicted DNA-binding transcriptional regulator